MHTAITALRRIPLFAGLREGELRRLTRIALVHKAPKGTLVFKKKTAGKHLFVVLSGEIKVFSELSAAGRKKTFAFLRKGDFFGEMSLLDSQGRSLSAYALEETTLMSLSQGAFERLLKKEPRFTLRVLKTLIERLRRANEEIESLTFRSLYGRICRKLLDVSDQDSGSGSVAITHVELADLTGTAREMVTKVLSSLRRMQVIAYLNHHIKILKPSRLRELAQPDSA